VISAEDQEVRTQGHNKSFEIKYSTDHFTDFFASCQTENGSTTDLSTTSTEVPGFRFAAAILFSLLPPSRLRNSPPFILLHRQNPKDPNIGGEDHGMMGKMPFDIKETDTTLSSPHSLSRPDTPPPSLFKSFEIKVFDGSLHGFFASCQTENGSTTDLITTSTKVPGFRSAATILFSLLPPSRLRNSPPLFYSST
jgi:hypothetical protein